MPINISPVDRRKITALYISSLAVSVIKSNCGTERINITMHWIYQTIQQFEETGDICDRPRTGRPKHISEDHKQFIDQALSRNRELTARKLR